MFIQIILVGGIVAYGVYGCAHIIASSYGIDLPLRAGWPHIIVWSAGPPISVIASLYAWSVARYWRRLTELRSHQLLHGMTAMGRGQHRLDDVLQGPSLLERVLVLAIVISLAAIPYWYFIPHAEIWVIGGLLSWWVVGWLLRRA